MLVYYSLILFRKDFDTTPRNKSWNRLEDIKVHFELRVAAIKLYEKVIAKFKNNEGWITYIYCNIEVKQVSPLSPIIFGIYIHKLESV